MRKKSKKDEVSDNKLVTYNNIIQTHKKICEHFEAQKEELPFYEIISDYLTDLTDRLENVNQFMLKVYLKKLHRRIKLIKTEEEYKSYLKDINPILNKYTPLSEKPIIISFMDSQKQDNPAEKYVDLYNNVARKYYPVIRVKKKITNVCSNCGNPGVRSLENRKICTNCGNFVYKNINNITYDDKEKIGLAAKYSYNRSSFFKTWVKKYQGKHNPTIPKKVYKKVHDLLTRYSTSIETLPKIELVLMLKDHDMSDYVEDINFLYYDMMKQWAPQVKNCNPPDIIKFESKLYAEYNMYDEVYNEVIRIAKEKDPTIRRENSTNSFYTLCKLLEKQGFYVSKEDKYIFLKRDEKIIEHDNIWKIACQILSWNYIETL